MNSLIIKNGKEIWLNFSRNYPRNSGDEFLNRFSIYLEEGYKNGNDCDFIEPAWAEKRHTLLKEMLDFDAMSTLIPSSRYKGYALIGRTGFNKVDFIKDYFKAWGLPELTNNETTGCYAVVDCSGIKGCNGLIKTLIKNQSAAYVVFDNCDSLLKHDEALQIFNCLSEDFPGLTIIKKNGETENFKTDSRFIFLGEENTLHLAVDRKVSKGLGASAYNRFNAFVHYIHVYDFDKGERYYGNDVSPIFA